MGKLIGRDIGCGLGQSLEWPYHRYVMIGYSWDYMLSGEGINLTREYNFRRRSIKYSGNINPQENTYFK